MKLKDNLKKHFKKAIDLFKYYTTKINKKSVMFVSFSGKSYSDNPKAISEALHKLSPNVKIVWGFTDIESKKNVVPDYVECVNIDNRFDNHYYSSAVVVSNFSLPNIKKSPKQCFIQTWHGDRAFKKVLYDSPFASDDFFTLEERKDYCNLAIAGSDYGEMQYRSAFHYQGEVLKVGTPRDDVLVNPNTQMIEEIRKSLNIDSDKRILLYAPTLRRENANKKTAQISLVDIEETLSCLNSKFDSEWICLMRSHPAIKGLCGVEYGERVLDVSSYEDMSDLLLISDMLITDYSSCAGDFALTGRPIVLFQSDFNEYIVKDRDFYFEMKDSPYYVAKSQNELNDIICNFDPESIKQNCKDILNFYGTKESGNSSEIVAMRILDWLDKLK